MTDFTPSHVLVTVKLFTNDRLWFSFRKRTLKIAYSRRYLPEVDILTTEHTCNTVTDMFELVQKYHNSIYANKVYWEFCNHREALLKQILSEDSVPKTSTAPVKYVEVQMSGRVSVGSSLSFPVRGRSTQVEHITLFYHGKSPAEMVAVILEKLGEIEPDSVTLTLPNGFAVAIGVATAKFTQIRNKLRMLPLERLLQFLERTKERRRICIK